MKTIVNYKPTKEKIEEFQVVQILEGADVFADLPLAVAEFGRLYAKPVLFGDYKGLPTIIDKEELEEHLKHLELHHFRIENEKLIKVDKEQSELSLRLPKGTSTDQLIMDRGQVVWAKPEEVKGEDINGDS